MRPSYENFKAPRREHTRVSARGDSRGLKSVPTEAAKGGKDAAIHLLRRRLESAVPESTARWRKPLYARAREEQKDWKAAATLQRCHPHLQVAQVLSSDLRVKEIFIGVELSDDILQVHPPLGLILCSCHGRSVPSKGGGRAGSAVPPTSLLPISWESAQSFGR